MLQEVLQSHLVQAQTVWDDDTLYAASLRAEPRAPAGGTENRRRSVEPRSSLSSALPAGAGGRVSDAMRRRSLPGPG